MLDFFEQQDAARRRTWRMAAILVGMVLGTILATAVVLAGLTTVLGQLYVSATTTFKVDYAYLLNQFIDRFWIVTGVAGVAVIGIAVHRSLKALESGGVEVARQMGGTRVAARGESAAPGGENLRYQQLMNVVEELSIASGTKMPKVFVLEQESGINAFAAGMKPQDTVVGVTRGALEHLNRSQLQGVLAHEFSHIVNLDVRINVQTLGALQGIEAVASVARFLVRLGQTSSMQLSFLPTIFGCLLWPVGQIGVFFGALARMAINRQREFLADAAAVQFTRSAEGLSSALRLIEAHERQGRLESKAARHASHFFFADGSVALGGLLRSHPPIELRIQRLDPSWKGMASTAPAATPWPTVATAAAAVVAGLVTGLIVFSRR
jgi:Zn-dependent protease with chaperone function